MKLKKCCDTCLYGSTDTCQKIFEEDADCINHRFWTPFTNREWLESLTDEELGNFLCKHSSCISKKCIGYAECTFGGNGIERWLKEQVKV